ncbi:MAG: hypothetical protein KAS48_01070 [Gammaproteobacteria bacterium]|nr:hypothetical protein [Gammaproteobacteria bacterium]
MKNNNNKTYGLPFVGLIMLQFSILLSACTSTEEAVPQGQSVSQNISQKVTQQKQQTQNVLMLKFQEGEPEVGPYITRMLVANDYLRMDDGGDQDDFTLFDRKQKIIYSVTHENKNILVIPNHPVKGTWVDSLKLEEKSYEDPDTPLISGKRPIQTELLVNGKVCQRMVVVPGLHEPAIKALIEFRQVLASEHMQNLDKTPVEMQDPCFLGYEVRNPDKVLQFGFPIQQQDYMGKTRLLLDYKSGFSVNSSVFQLPQGYGQFSSQDMQ